MNFIKSILLRSVVSFMMITAASCLMAQTWPTVTLPTFPTITSANTFNIVDYGASATATDNTSMIQKALDAAKNAGGGKVVVPAGTFLTGPILMGSNTIFSISKGATLQALPYGTYPVLSGTGTSVTYDNLIGCYDNSKNLCITGGGTLYGDGTAWWAAYKSIKSRGCMIRFKKGFYILIDSITIKDAPGVNITIGMSGNSSDATIHDVTISEPSSHASTPSHNTDGISTWCPRINIYHCNISNGDDNVVADANTQYLHVWDCTFGDGHGASVGSYTSNVKHILFEGISFSGTDSGFRLKSNTDRGGGEEDITIQNCTMNKVLNPVYITSWYDKEEPSTGPQYADSTAVTSTTPAFKDILIKNIVSYGTPYNSSIYANFPVYIYGRPEQHLNNIIFDHVKIHAAKGMLINFSDQVKFINGCEILDTTKTGTNRTKIYQSYKSTITGTYDGSIDEIKSVSSDPVPAAVKSIRYYDLSGRRVDTSSGLIIRDILYADGKSKVDKIFSK